MANGILIVDKPADWTSQDVAAKLRGVFHERRVGHGGTLDPMATGVLPIFIGRSTRAVEFFESAEKEYIAGIRLGVSTDTQDICGTVLETRPVTVSGEDFGKALKGFLGEQEQLPPMYSAVKIGGKKLYELARRGQEVARSPRRIVIKELELLGGEGDTYSFRVLCSKGTYVRTLCHDLGAALGCGACLCSLRRTKAGIYTLAEARTMEEILAAKEPERLLLPADSLFPYEKITVPAPAEQKCRNGAFVRMANLPDGLYRVYTESGEFLLLGKVQGGVLTTVKSFFEVK